MEEAQKAREEAEALMLARREELMKDKDGYWSRRMAQETAASLSLQPEQAAAAAAEVRLNVKPIDLQSRGCPLMPGTGLQAAICMLAANIAEYASLLLISWILLRHRLIKWQAINAYLQACECPCRSLTRWLPKKPQTLQLRTLGLLEAKQALRPPTWCLRPIASFLLRSPKQTGTSKCTGDLATWTVSVVALALNESPRNGQLMASVGTAGRARATAGRTPDPRSTGLLDETAAWKALARPETEITGSRSKRAF